MLKHLFATSAIILALTVGAAADDDATPKTHSRIEAMKARQEATLAKLPKEKADTLRQAMEQQRDQAKAAMKKLKTLRGEQEALLTADTFDKEAYIAKSKEIDAAFAAMHGGWVEAVADVATGMTKEERQVLLELRPGKGSWKRGGKKHHDSDDDDTPEVE